MTRLLAIIGFLLVATGCATHYSRVQDGALDLYLYQPDAQRVYLACSLDGFEPHPARKIDRRWVVTLPQITQFKYYYLLDGKVYLPPCKMKEHDDFGSQNCIYDPDL